MAKPTATQIKQAFPKEWQELCERFEAAQKSKKPSLPLETFKKMRKKAEDLTSWRQVQFGPTASFPFVADCILMWECEDCVSFEGVEHVRPRPGASKEERKLFDILGMDIYTAADLIEDHVHKTRGFKDFLRDIQEFNREISRLESQYNFNPDDIIEGM